MWGLIRDVLIERSAGERALRAILLGAAAVAATPAGQAYLAAQLGVEAAVLATAAAAVLGGSIRAGEKNAKATASHD